MNTYILVIKKEMGEREIETSNPTTHKSPSPSKNKYSKFLSSFLEIVRLKSLKKCFYSTYMKTILGNFLLRSFKSTVLWTSFSKNVAKNWRTFQQNKFKHI